MLGIDQKSIILESNEYRELMKQYENSMVFYY